LEVEIETVLKINMKDLKDQRVISVLCAMDICPSGKLQTGMETMYRWKPPGSEIGRRINQRDILQFSHIATLSAED